MNAADLTVIRRAYAHQMVALTGADDPRLERAFAAVPREDFLGPPPWTIRGFNVAPRSFAESDPVLVYQDVLVALDPARAVNNGSPSLHALMMRALDVQPGETVLHVGAGTGYYTAILAELVGPSGRVIGIEFDARLAEATRRNLAPWPNATAIAADGAQYPKSTVQRIYVNFAVVRPAPLWLDRLADGGSLLFPLGVPHPQATGDRARSSARGAVLLITRQADGFAARHITPCSFVMAEGELAGTPEARAALYAAFKKDNVEFVQSLRRGASPPERSWFWQPDWSLSYDPPPDEG